MTTSTASAFVDRSQELDLSQQRILHFPLYGLLFPGQSIALHTTLGIVTQFALADNGPELVEQQLFAPGEICLLKPLLEAYPDYCPTEVLLANIAGGSVTERAIERSRRRLHAALDGGTWSSATAPVRNILSRVRLKMHLFEIDIFTIIKVGYGLRRKPGERRTEPLLEKGRSDGAKADERRTARR